MKEEQQEPTIKELLQIMFEMLDYTISVLNENRTFWRNSFDGKYTNFQSYTEMKKLRDQIKQVNKDTDAQLNKAVKHFVKYKHLLDLEEKELKNDD